MPLAEDLIRYVAESPSPFHCVNTSAQRLLAAGFTEHYRDDEPRAIRAGGGGFLREAGTLLAWRSGSVPPAVGGFRAAVAHTDSPNLRLKPRAEFTREGYRVWGVEKYGGLILATWADRDLGVAGRVGVRTPSGLEMRLVMIDRPVARIPNLAIHLNRGVNDKGLVLNPQTQMNAMIGLAGADDSDRLRGLVAESVGCAVEDLLDWELGLYDLQAPVIGGIDGEFIFSARMDNQFCSYSVLQALIDAPVGDATSVVALYDHEEVGSRSARGAGSVLLRNLLRMLERDYEERAPGGLERALARSFLISADMAHGVHPGFADKHDPHHKPMLNGGPVLKSNANIRYMSDSRSASLFRVACDALEIPLQDFNNRSDLACGSTVGPFAASQLGITTVDVGCAMLSMHSAREQAGAEDVDDFVRVIAHLLGGR